MSQAQVQSPAQYSGLKIQRCHSCNVVQNYGSNLISDLATPYVMEWQKERNDFLLISLLLPKNLFSSNIFTKAWAAKAKGGIASDGAEEKKRKRVVDESHETENQEEKTKENLNLPKKQKPLNLSANQKLSAFAFKQE